MSQHDDRITRDVQAHATERSEGALTRFEAAWIRQERRKVRTAIECFEQAGKNDDTGPWLCVASRLQNQRVYIAMKLQKPKIFGLADSAAALSEMIVSNVNSEHVSYSHATR